MEMQVLRADLCSQRGIEANPAKIKAIQGLKKPEELKDVQKLTGCIAALSRFISRLGEKAIPLYRLLKKSDKFVWDQEADDAFELLKKWQRRPSWWLLPQRNLCCYTLLLDQEL